MTSDHVLKELNRFRAEHFDLEPLEEMPKGHQMSTFGCPVANSLPDGWSVLKFRAYDPHDDEPHDLPDAVSRFIDEFDTGLHPHLIER